MSSPEPIVIVFISGFLAPHGRPCPPEWLPPHVKLITVHPSGVASLHDRAMQIFYELKGGTVHYGQNHAAFHKHNEEGDTYKHGLYPEWDASRPIHLVGHSFGGITARVLHQYLAEKNMFQGHRTSQNWVVSVTTLNSPLNGSLMVYSLGANLVYPPLVRWGSLGCLINMLAHTFEYFSTIAFVRSLYNFKLGHWFLGASKHGSFHRWIFSLLGLGVQSHTDNSAYDMTIHSQLAWASRLETFPGTYYLSLYGTSFETAGWLYRLVYRLRIFVLKAVPTRVENLDTSGWMDEGFDGLVSAKSQAYPFLDSKHPVKLEQLNDSLKGGTERSDQSGKSIDEITVRPGIWYCKAEGYDHVGVLNCEYAWKYLSRAIECFHKHYIEKGGLNGPATRSRTTRTGKSATSRKLTGIAIEGAYILPNGSKFMSSPDTQMPRWVATAEHREQLCISKDKQCGFAEMVCVVLLVAIQFVKVISKFNVQDNFSINQQISDGRISVEGFGGTTWMGIEEGIRGYALLGVLPLLAFGGLFAVRGSEVTSDGLEAVFAFMRIMAIAYCGGVQYFSSFLSSTDASVTVTISAKATVHTIMESSSDSVQGAISLAAQTGINSLNSTIAALTGAMTESLLSQNRLTEPEIWTSALICAEYLFIIDAVCCTLICHKSFEYCAPVTKCLIALALAAVMMVGPVMESIEAFMGCSDVGDVSTVSVGESATDSSTCSMPFSVQRVHNALPTTHVYWILALMVADICVLLAKFAWTHFTYRKETPLPSEKTTGVWVALWASFIVMLVTSQALMVMCVYENLVEPVVLEGLMSLDASAAIWLVLCVFLFRFTVIKLRDMSECFQFVTIPQMYAHIGISSVQG